MKIKAIIVDDEADSRDVLAMAIANYCPDIEVAQLCATPQEGITAIQNEQPDVVFLDVQMPHMSGFELLERVGEIDFEVIFVTAYDKYAIKAIKCSALDYLLKPIDIDDLLQAARKIGQRQQQTGRQQRHQALADNTKLKDGQVGQLAIPTQEGIVFLHTKDIVYCQADGNYTLIYQTGQQKTLVSKSLKEFEQTLLHSGFCRVHHAYLVNLAHIQKYIRGEGGYIVLSEGYHVDVSRRKKEEFMKLIDKV